MKNNKRIINYAIYIYPLVMILICVNYYKLNFTIILIEIGLHFINNFKTRVLKFEMLVGYPHYSY